MDYGFARRVDRRNMGSSKWDAMLTKDPAVPPGIVPLSVADMELESPPEVLEGLRLFLEGAVLGYARPTPAFNAAVTGWMKKRHGWDIRTEWLVQAPGVVPALFMAVRAFTEPGDGVIIQPPVYYPFNLAAEKNGRRIVRNPLKIVDGRYRMDFEDLAVKAQDPANRMLILCSPHNPVGRVWAREELERLFEICAGNGVIVISDEIHADLVLPGGRHTVFAALSEDAALKSITCTAPSKTFNLAGMQLSNIIIPDETLRRTFRAEMQSSGLDNPPILGIKACETAYTRCEAWLDALLALVDSNRRLVEDFFARNLPGIKVFPLEGSYLMWLDFRCLDLDARALEEFMIREARWFTDEGVIFGAEGAGFERVNIACPAAVLEEALDRLLTAMKRAGLERRARVGNTA